MMARPLTRAEWKAARAHARKAWSIEARLAYERTGLIVNQFGLFLVMMVILAGIMGAFR